MRKIVLMTLLAGLSLATFGFEGKYEGRYEEQSLGEQSGKCLLKIESKGDKLKVTANFKGKKGRNKYVQEKVPFVSSAYGIETYEIKKFNRDPEISELCDYLDFCFPKEINETITVNVKDEEVVSVELDLYPFGRYYVCNVEK